MSAMGEPYYSVHAARSHFHNQDLSPYTPVSPFSMPIQYDSPLGTPVSLSHSHPIHSPTLSTQKDTDIKLSPTQMSPTYPWLGCDDEYDEGHKSSEMKHKDPPGTRRISASDNSFPTSPVVCYTPYFGQFGVSATPVSATNSSASMISSPLMASTNGHSRGDNTPRHNNSPRMSEIYRVHDSPVILHSTPNPLTLRTTLKSNGPDFRRDSLQDNLQPVSPGSLTPSSVPEILKPLPPRRKRKPLGETQEGEILLSGEMNTEERLLLQLTEEQNLPWKDVATKFKELTGKAMKVPALQMRKKRLIERLRLWTPQEEQALVKAWEDYGRSKWETIANNMPKFGCPEKWPKELVEKKWQEMHSGDDSPCDPDYDSKCEGKQRTFSDGGGSRSNSLHEGEGGPTASSSPSEDGDSRAGSDTTSPLHYLQSQQMMYHTQQQHGVWASET